jgi:hypothetical protein
MISRKLEYIVATSRPVDPRNAEWRPGLIMHPSRGLIYPRRIWFRHSIPGSYECSGNGNYGSQEKVLKDQVDGFRDRKAL